MITEASAVWVVVPAAGTGTRMQSAVPKQYLPLGGSTVLGLTLQRLLALSQVRGIMLALDSQELQADGNWRRLHSAELADNPRIRCCAGGGDRHGSVLNALQALSDEAADDDWVLVHDAVRPCVRVADMQSLLQAVHSHACGGLLAAPVRDTLKRAEANDTVAGTLDRRSVWAAFTPQAFRYRMLRDALQQAARQGLPVTDESSALEAAGHAPLLVRGNPDNIKITHPEDLPLAAAILAAQASSRV